MSTNPSAADYGSRQGGIAGSQYPPPLPKVQPALISALRTDLLAIPVEDRTAAMTEFLTATA